VRNSTGMANTVTRAELYQLVWTTPMSHLASEFGVSDVALAKTCKRWDIPRPGRGYWAQLEAGLKPEQPPLSESPPPNGTVLSRSPNPLPPRPRLVAPDVPLPKKLSKTTDAVRDLGKKLVAATRDEYDRLVVGAPEAPALAVTVATHRRALALLEGLSRVLLTRGHAIELVESGERFALVVTVEGQHRVPISVLECLDQKNHVLTAAEQEQVAHGSKYGIPKYDSFAGGRLQLRLGTDARARRSWSDSSTRKVERTLGSVVLALEGELAARRQQALEAEERQRRAAEEERQREEERRREREREALLKHREALAKDLRAKATAWAEAQDVRAFVRAVADAVPPEARDATLGAWLAWADEHARSLDPLSQPNTLAKPLDPPRRTEATGASRGGGS
jgi:hypothetical protein